MVMGIPLAIPLPISVIFLFVLHVTLTRDVIEGIFPVFMSMSHCDNKNII